MKIVILDGNTTNPGDLSWKGLEGLGELTVYERTPAELVVERIGDAPIILTNKTPITAQVMEACPALRYVGVLATGYNVVDIAAAEARGIVVTNIPGYSTPAVAQHAIALLLELCSNVALNNASVKAGEWQNCIDFCYWKAPIIELAGKTFGAVGFGQTGRATARVAKALGMEILAAGSRPTDEGRALGEYVELDELLRRSDVVSLHCPLMPATNQLIRKENIEKMKPTALLINTARGGVVHEADLAEALNSGRIAGAAVDVTSTEPIAADNPLLTAKNCVITPHLAWAARDSRVRLIDIATSNVRAFIGGAPVNTVTK